MLLDAVIVISNTGDSFLGRLELFERLKNEGYQPHLVAPAITAENKKKFMDLGYVCHEMPLARTGLNPLKDFSSFLALRRIIASVKPKAVISYTIKPVVYGMWAAMLEKVAVRAAMITGLGFVYSEDIIGIKKILARLIQKLHKTALSCATHVFFQNKDDASLFQRLNLVSKEKCHFLNGSGVNLNHYQYMPAPSLNNGVHFLLIARLLEDKGIREYINAAKQVKENYPNTVFHLVGWIDSNPAAIKQNELDDWIRNKIIVFHGKLSDVREVINQTHVSVLPSYREGVPRVLLEAMAVGRAIIATDAPGCRETVKEGYNGFLVKVKSSDELARAMIQFVEKEENVSVMGRNSRLYAEERFDVQHVNRDMLLQLGLI